MNTLNEIIEKCKEILSISKEKIEFKLDSTIFFEAELNWDRNSLTWTILYKEKLDEYYTVHELGHIYLARKKMNFDGFAVQAPEDFVDKWDYRLKPLFNQLLDVFVDYNISQFDEIYGITRKKYIYYLEKKEDFEEMVDESEEFLELLSWYLVFFILFKFILREKEREKFSQEIDHRINYVKNSLLSFKSVINFDIFEELNEKLSFFDKIKEETDPKQIILFIINIIYTFNFWTKEELIKQAKIWFQL